MVRPRPVASRSRRREADLVCWLVFLRVEGLSDYEVRDLNDEINKLLREKHHWENQIITLGGANYKRAAGKTMDADGKEVPGARGYK
jgi:hypothetical protein